MEHAAPHQITVKALVERLGRKDIQNRVGARSKSSISQACADNRFPAAWFAVIRDMCSESGSECPLSLFNFIEPEPARASVQQSDRSGLLGNPKNNPAAIVADQDASGRRDGGGAAPDRNSVTVNGRFEAGGKTGTVEPAAGPAESRLAAAGRHTPADDPVFDPHG